MTALSLVRLGIDRTALVRFAIARDVSDDDHGYALHVALRQRFGAAGPQPFRVMEGKADRTTMLGYVADANALSAAESIPCVDPLIEAIFPTAAEVRPMPDRWSVDQRLRFDVRIRPTVRFGARIRAERSNSSGGRLRRAGEIDAFLAASDKVGPETPVDRETVYRHWLTSRLQPASAVESVVIAQMERASVRRSRHAAPDARVPRTASSEAYAVTARGTLVIQDPDRFAALLERGVGRHRAFGYGMLLLAPPGPTAT